MRQKNPEKTGTGSPVADSPGEIRNVVLVGHSGVGKTALVEALLVATGTTSRAGTLAEDTTVRDYDPATLPQQRSVSLSCAPFRYDGVKVNLIDTPGHPDFLGEVRAGLRAGDAALFVLPAVNSMDAATIALWEECAAAGMPRAIAVSGLDHPQADFDETVALCGRVFGDGVLPLYLPMLGDDGVTVAGLMSLITQRVFDYSAGASPLIRKADPEHLPAIEDARNELIEGIIAESADEGLMERYLSGEPIETDLLIDDLEKAVEGGHLYPVIPVCAETGVGLNILLEVLTTAFPSPQQRELPVFTGVDGSPRPPLTCDPEGPLLAEVVKTATDGHVGRVSLVRVFSGTLRPGQPLHVTGHGRGGRGRPDHDADEHLSHLYSPLGAALHEVPSCIAGDICAITELSNAETGDTLSGRDDPLLIEAWEMPEPLLPVAVVAKSRADEDALARNLSRLLVGDLALRVELNPETRQLVLWCTGETHVELVLDRLRIGGVDLKTEPVRVALRETFATSVQGHGRHVKQSGGHEQYAACEIEVEPLPRGGGFEFVVVDGAVPPDDIPLVEKGVRAQMERGVAAGYPVVDIRVTLVDGEAHGVGSSNAAFQTAGALALQDAARKGRVDLLEPIDEVVIRVPSFFVGAVLNDLSSRRGQVLGTEADTDGGTVVRAEVPAAELLRYAVGLRSITSGAGTFHRSFVRYEPMPAHLADQVREEAAAAP